MADYRDLDGRPLDARVAAVELLNLLRPTVAVDRFITFAALALHTHPEWRTRLRDRDGPDVELFVQDVRRFYPFFPMAGARVRTAFDWQGVHFPRGRRVLLDLYGTDHHPRLWDEPDKFRPDRFARRNDDAYDFVPQGGGDHHQDHRCAGEWITIALMTTAVTMLTMEMDYDVPDQDLRVSLRRMPTLPASRFVITNIKRTRDPARHRDRAQQRRAAAAAEQASADQQRQGAERDRSPSVGGVPAASGRGGGRDGRSGSRRRAGRRRGG